MKSVCRCRGYEGSDAQICESVTLLGILPSRFRQTSGSDIAVAKSQLDLPSDHFTSPCLAAGCPKFYHHGDGKEPTNITVSTAFAISTGNDRKRLHSPSPATFKIMSTRPARSRLSLLRHQAPLQRRQESSMSHSGSTPCPQASLINVMILPTFAYNVVCDPRSHRYSC